jgi:hypothetical protein
MKTTSPVDAARIELLLSDLRLPGIKLMWAKLAEQSDKEGWPAARFLAALAEHEIADRGVSALPAENISEPTGRQRSEKKGPLASANGPSLGRKRPRRAAVTRQRYRTATRCPRTAQNTSRKSKQVDVLISRDFHSQLFERIARSKIERANQEDKASLEGEHRTIS